ncbi:MAG: right-handed parallel beta-helix repeat-containing protein [Planctomycetaceae bacterium]
MSGIPGWFATRRRLLVTVLTLWVARSSCAAGQSGEINVIKETPVRISAPGVYRLASDLCFGTPHGAAVTVEADDVTIDLNGRTLSGTVGENTLAIVIQGVGRSNLSITNGRITGFCFGIDLRASKDGSSQSYVVSNMTLARNFYFGMRVVGSDWEIRHCTISDIGDSSRPHHTIPQGVRLVGARNTMRDCTIIDLRLRRFDEGQGEIVGVHFDAARDSLFERNIVIELANEGDDSFPVGESKERTFGMWINGGPEKDTFVVVRHNTFAGFTAPIAFAPGSDGRVTGNRFYNAGQKPVRGKPSGQSSENKSFAAQLFRTPDQ